MFRFIERYMLTVISPFTITTFPLKHITEFHLSITRISNFSLRQLMNAYLSYKNTSIFSTASKIKFFVHLHFERYPYLINQLPKQSIDLWTGKLVKWTMIIAIIDPYTITTHCSLCWNLRSLSQRRK